MDQTSPKMLTSWSGGGTSDKLIFLALLSWIVNSWIFPKASKTTERVFSFEGLTLFAKSLLEGALEAIMWAKWGSSSIPFGRGDLYITHPELCD